MTIDGMTEQTAKHRRQAFKALWDSDAGLRQAARLIGVKRHQWLEQMELNYSRQQSALIFTTAGTDHTVGKPL